VKVIGVVKAGRWRDRRGEGTGEVKVEGFSGDRRNGAQAGACGVKARCGPDGAERAHG
jgi:hypothetical protein